MYIKSQLGDGAILKRKPPTLYNIGIDLDATAIANFSCDYPAELIHGCDHGFEKDCLAYSDPQTLKVPARHLSGISTATITRKADHVELLETLKSLPFQVMVSGHRSAASQATCNQ